MNLNKSKCRITDYSEDIVKDDRKCKNCLSKQDIIRIVRKTIQDVIQDLPEGPTGPEGPKGDPGDPGPTGPKGDPGDTELELHIKDLDVWGTIVDFVDNTRPNWTIVLTYEGEGPGGGDNVNDPYPGQEWTWDGTKWELTEDSSSPPILGINSFSATSTSIHSVSDLTINVDSIGIPIIKEYSVDIQGSINIDTSAIPDLPSYISGTWYGSLMINSFEGTPYNPLYSIGITIEGSFINLSPFLVNLSWVISGTIEDNNNFSPVDYNTISGNIGSIFFTGESFDTDKFTIDNTIIKPPFLVNSKGIKSSRSNKNELPGLKHGLSGLKHGLPGLLNSGLLGKIKSSRE